MSEVAANAEVTWNVLCEGETAKGNNMTCENDEGVGVKRGEGAGDDAQMWAIRSSACELLALSLRFPEPELADIVSSGEWADAACEIWGVLGIDLPEDWASDLDSFDFHDVRAEATRMFVGTPKPACSPYEGFWRAEDEGVQPLMFVNPHTMDVERFCRSCGLGPSGGANEPLDHIATEFELLQYLSGIAARIARPASENVSENDFPGGSAAVAYGQFMDEHVRSFAARFAARLEEGSRVAYYRAVGRLLGAYVRAS